MLHITSGKHWVQNVCPFAFILPIDHLPSSGQEHNHTRVTHGDVVPPLNEQGLSDEGRVRRQWGAIAYRAHLVTFPHDLHDRPYCDSTA